MASRIIPSHSSIVRGFSTKMQSDVSIFHLIIWLFIVPEKSFSEQQKKKIKGFYFAQEHQSMAFDPLPPRQQLQKTIQCIQSGNRDCVIKVVVSNRYLRSLSKILNKSQKIIEVYKFIENPNDNGAISQQKEQKLQNQIQNDSVYKMQEINGCYKYVQSSIDLNEFILRAQKEVQKFTKNFRHFYNSLPLIKAFANDANRYRLHLLCSIKLKSSDMRQYLDYFKNFCHKEFPYLSKHLQKIGQRQLSRNQYFYLENYLQKAQQFIQSQIQHANELLKIKKQESKKEIIDQTNLQRRLQQQQKIFDKRKAVFYTDVLDTYQTKRFFYQILNSTLKTVIQKSRSIVFISQEVKKKKTKNLHINNMDLYQILPGQYQKKKHTIQNIKYVSLPFSHTYKAINFFYKQQVQKQMQKGYPQQKKFYTKPFTVYRLGRIGQNQLKYYKKNSSKMFVEFFGFVSTTLDINIALNFHPFKTQRDSEQYDEDKPKDDIVCLFKINCKFHPQILKYDFANSGFFRYNETNAQKNKQKQVLFNSLNIFKVVSVKKVKKIDLLPKSEQQRIQRQDNVYKQSLNDKFYRQNAKKFYQEQIRVIELQYGDFHRVLLENNPYNLLQQQKIAKESFLQYINKALKYKFQKLDHADVCQLLNELMQAYHFLKAKIQINLKKCSDPENLTEQHFEISQLDDKNYCLRLSQICLKLGKIKQALYYARLSEKCHEVMSKYQMKQIYNKHYQQFFQMQERIVSILQENSDFLTAEKELKRQIKCISSQKFKDDPKVQLRHSEKLINLGVTEFQIGKLKESLQSFRDCSKFIQFAKTQISITEVEEPTWKDYFSNCLKPSSIFCPCNYFEAQKQRRIQEKQIQIQIKFGNSQQLVQTENMIKDVSGKAKETFKYQLKFFKNQAQYQQLLRDFNTTINKESTFRKIHRQQGQSLQQEIKKIMTQLSTVSINSDQYKEYYENFKMKFQNIKDLGRLKIISADKADIIKFIQKFQDKERQRRIRHLQQRKQFIKISKIRKFKLQYQKQVIEIKKVIKNLTDEGYLQNTTNILKHQNAIAKLLITSENYQKAEQQIQNIIKYDDDKYEKKHYELANAYFTQAQIHYHRKNAGQCIQAIEKAIQHIERTFLQNKSIKDIDLKTESLSNVSRATKQEKISEQDQQKAVEIIKQHNLYLQIKILKVKAHLLQYESNYLLQQKQENLIQIQSIIEGLLIQISEVFNKKDQIQDIDNLKTEYLQVHALFILIRKGDIQDAFELISECLQIRNKKLGYPNAPNTLFCSQIINKYYHQKQIRELIHKHQLSNITKVHFKFKHCSFYQTIYKAFLQVVEDQNILVQVQKQIEAQNSLTKVHLDAEATSQVIQDLPKEDNLLFCDELKQNSIKPKEQISHEQQEFQEEHKDTMISVIPKINIKNTQATQPTNNPSSYLNSYNFTRSGSQGPSSCDFMSKKEENKKKLLKFQNQKFKEKPNQRQASKAAHELAGLNIEMINKRTQDRKKQSKSAASDITRIYSQRERRGNLNMRKQKSNVQDIDSKRSPE